MWTFFDTSIVVAYLAVMIGLGIYLRTKVKEISDFLVARREMSWWVAAISMFATYNSIWAFTGAIGFAYGVGAPVLFFYLGASLGNLVQAYLAPRIRATRGLTMFTFYENRFPGMLRPILAVVQSCTYFLDGGMRFFATAIIPAVFLGWATNTTIVLLFGITVIYVTLSGMRGVMVSDTIQGLIMFVVFIVAVAIGLGNLGGIGGMARKVDPLYFNLVNVRFPFLACLSLFCSAFFTHIISIGFTSNRLLTTKTLRDARTATITDSLLTIVFGLFVVVAGILTLAHVPGLKGAQVEQSFAEYLKMILPTGLLGLFLVAALAATMSTIDSQAHNITGWITTDIYQNKVNPKISPEKLLVVARFVIIGVLVLFLLCSYSPKLLGGIFHLVVSWLMPITAPTALVMGTGLLWRRLSAKGAYLATFFPYIVFAIQKSLGIWARYTGFTIPAIAIIMIIFAMLFFKPSEDEKAKIDDFLDTIERAIEEEKKGTSGA